MSNHCSITSRDLVSVASNPSCQRLVALRSLPVSERAAYRMLTGKEIPEGRGERTAALRHGKAFDQRLTRDRGAALREAVSNISHVKPQDASVVNVEQACEELPGNPLVEALTLTHCAMYEAATTGPQVDILLQPALELTVPGFGKSIIRPDALVLNRKSNTYWPLEAKAFPALDGAVDQAKRRALRLQAAVQLLALEQMQLLIPLPLPLPMRAILLVASPFALKPVPATLEHLESERDTIAQAITAISQEASRLTNHLERRSFEEALRGSTYHFQESCHLGCGLAAICRPAGLPVTLGDAASHVLHDMVILEDIELFKQDHPEAHATLLDVLGFYGVGDLRGAC